MFKALGIFLIESSGIPKAQTQHSAPDTKSAEQSGENIWQQGCNKWKGKFISERQKVY